MTANSGASNQDGHGLDYDGEGYDYMLKMLVLGESGVGKSCVLLRFAENTFNESFISTVGVDFKFRTVEIDGKMVKLQIWDTAGQERFRTITSSFYRGANGILLVFDVTDKKSFQRIEAWVTQINSYAPTKVPIMLCGNKVDLVSKRVVPFDDAKELANKFGWKYIETSAKDGSNVKEAFTSLASQILPGIRALETKVAQHQKLQSGGGGACCTIL